jgi:2-oxoglutarate ferredoxin oxidoreductase subunit alpha
MVPASATEALTPRALAVPDRPKRVLMKGNEAIAEAAIQAGCDAYFGYPITPQAELLEWMARRMPEEGRVFIQAESELGAINMALGAAATGARVLVSSSSPGMSLMAEAMSYMAGQEVPVVLINVMRGGPGLGSIQPSQSDYFQATKGHGHGDYRVPVLAPASIGEAMDLVATAFELAERYRTPVIILADGILGQAMEPVEQRYRTPERVETPWALTGADGREPRVVRSLHLNPEELEAHNEDLQAKFHRIAGHEVRWTGEQLDDAELVIVAYGTAARVARTAIARARAAGMRVGLFRPITLWPFPEFELAELSQRVRGMLVVELSAGQMVEDVRLAVEGRCAVAFDGRMGGMVPSPDEVVAALGRLDESERQGMRTLKARRPRRHAPHAGPRPVTRAEWHRPPVAGGGPWRGDDVLSPFGDDAWSPQWEEAPRDGDAGSPSPGAPGGVEPAVDEPLASPARTGGRP